MHPTQRCFFILPINLDDQERPSIIGVWRNLGAVIRGQLCRPLTLRKCGNRLKTSTEMSMTSFFFFPNCIFWFWSRSKQMKKGCCCVYKSLCFLRIQKRRWAILKWFKISHLILAIVANGRSQGWIRNYYRKIFWRYWLKEKAIDRLSYRYYVLSSRPMVHRSCRLSAAGLTNLLSKIYGNKKFFM